MNTVKIRVISCSIFIAFCLSIGQALVAAEMSASSVPCEWIKEAAPKVERELVAKYGEVQRIRIHRGLVQVNQFWRAEDGNAAVYEAFVLQNFAGNQEALDTLFNRFERLLEKLGGHLTELRYEFRLQTDLASGPILPVDEAFAAYEPGAHINDDFFGNKLAFMVLLNFPLTTLEQNLAEGSNWSRRQWAEVRLAQQFSKRIPANIQQDLSDSVSDAEIYISQYNVCMHHVLNEKGERLFPAKLRLSSHWGLRDEIKAQYNNGTNGLARQRLILKILEKVIDQSIPAAVINNPLVDWTPASNEVKASSVVDIEPDPSCKGLTVSNVAEPNTRYAKWLKVFQACRQVDPYSPTAPTLIARRFDEDRQMSEARVKAMLEQLLTSSQLSEVGRLIEKRLGRPLEPFDIWYNGFRPRLIDSQQKRDAMVRSKYPTPEAFLKGIPDILKKLGFSAERAAFLKDNISVQAGRNAGHAMGGAMRGQKARLRVRFGDDGLLFQDFNVAMHELGHVIEQTYSLNLVDHTLLQGVPNTAFTEGLAMLLQGHDLEMLGLAKPDATSEALTTLNDFWATCEIAIMALCDMEVWHWMYAHPEATPAELKAATLDIARNLWNTYYAPIFKQRDCILPGVYSHMINNVLYVPDYPVGHLMGFQIEEQMKKAGKIGPEFERITIMGNVTPDLWMKHATGAPVGAEAMLKATRRALDKTAQQ
ncbi:MAG: hypothetical protein WCP12_15250 [bacterium]